MKVSVAWLGAHLEGNPQLSTPMVAERLGEAGLQVASIEPSPVDPADSILDVEVTSNRNDCNSHRGLAREAAALLGQRLKPQDLAALELDSQRPAPGGVSVQVEDPTLSPHYSARVIRGVKVGPSPAWLADRLRAVGLRPVNNVVDITNYILLDLGQPLHAFDLARLRGPAIRVRRAQANEPFEAIDHSKHKLDRNICVIADALRPVAIAGVMGGVDSEVTAATTDLLLESARFDPLATRNAARRLGLKSDSSYRFERGVDPAGVVAASLLATQLIGQLAGGQAEGGLIHVGETNQPARTAVMRMARLAKVLGYDIPLERCRTILESLGFAILKIDETQIACRIPTWRLDCTREEDLIEEVVRLHGYQHIPARQRLEIVLKNPSAREQAERTIMETLTAGGYSETINPSRLEDHLAGLFAPGREPLRISARHGKGQSVLRDNLVTSLLLVAKHNQESGAVDERGLRLYEMATCFIPAAAEPLPRQPAHLGLLTSGSVRELRGMVETLLARLRVAERSGYAREDHDGVEPGTGLTVTFDKKPLGWLGRLEAKVLTRMGLKGTLAVGELNLDPLLELGVAVARMREIPRYPAIERDLSLVVSEGLRWEELEQTIRNSAPAELVEVKFGEIFRGKALAVGSKSVFIRLVFRSPQRSLTHPEVDGWQQNIVKQLEEILGAKLRTA